MYVCFTTIFKKPNKILTIENLKLHMGFTFYFCWTVPGQRMVGKMVRKDLSQDVVQKRKAYSEMRKN